MFAEIRNQINLVNEATLAIKKTNENLITRMDSNKKELITLMDKMEKKTDNMEKKMDNMEENMGKSFEGIARMTGYIYEMTLIPHSECTGKKL